MAITEDLDSFLKDFGTDATFGAETAKVIFDQPDVILDTLVVSASYIITYKTGVFAGMKYGDDITIDGQGYTVDVIQKMGDGKFTTASLSKN